MRHRSARRCWGPGSQGATYLNLVSDVAPVDGVIDINPRKNGWGVPGTGLSITPPDSLVEIRPRTVIVANPAYLDEVRSALRELGVDGDVIALWS